MGPFIIIIMLFLFSEYVPNGVNIMFHSVEDFLKYRYEGEMEEGKFFLSSDQFFMEERFGELKIPIFHEFSPIGIFTLQYMIILNVNEKNLEEKTNVGDFENKMVKFIGHRGSGSKEQGSRVRENTILSLQNAHQKG